MSDKLTCTSHMLLLVLTEIPLTLALARGLVKTQFIRKGFFFTESTIMHGEHWQDFFHS